MADTDYNGTLQGFVEDVAKGIKTAKHLGDGDSFAIYPSQFQKEISKLHDTSDVVIPFDSNGNTDYILTGYSAYTAAGKIKGVMPNKQNWSGTISGNTSTISVPKGYHNGNGIVSANLYPNTKTIVLSPDNPQGTFTANEEINSDGEITGYLGYPQVEIKYSGATYTVSGGTQSDTIAGYEYIDIPLATVEVSGGGLSATKVVNTTAAVSLSKGTNGNASLFSYTANEPTNTNSIYYVPIIATTEKISTHTTVERAEVTRTQTGGSIPEQEGIVDIKATSISPGVTINSGSATGYITIPKAVRATNDVNIDRYAANDYEYVEIQVSNNQGTGYVTGSNESTRVNIHAKEDTSGNFIVSTEDTANGEQEWYRINKSTASASGKTVTVPAGYIPSQQTVDVATVSRANTTISSLKDSDANTIILTASNNQGTGWVTGANKTASKVVSISANGATVTASDGTNSISKSVATVSRASTTVSATSDDTADTITVTGANNQGTGYVTGANKTASDTITLTQGTPSINTSTGIVTATSSMKDSVSSKSVSQSKTLNLTTKGATTITPTTSEQTAVAAGTYTTGAIKVAAIPGVTRANTTISVSANDTNDTLTVSASNNQSTGYVTGSNKTASTTITLTNSGKTVTATASDGTKISRNVATVTRADNTVNTQWEDYAYADTYGSVPWIQVHNDQGTGYVIGANKTSDIYILAGANSNGAYEVKTVAGGATETWYTIDKSTASASGKTVTVPAGYVPIEQNVSVSTVSRASTSITSTKDSTANTITLTASNNQGTGWVTGSNKTASKTISLSASGATVTATDGTNSISKSVATATQATPSVTINSSTGVVTGSATQTAGYVSAGTKSGTLQLSTQAATTITPGTSEKTAVAAGKYTLGAVKVAGDADLKAANIKKGVAIFGITGTYDPQPSTTTLTANPLWTSETYTPSGYDGYSSVTINAIPSIEFEIVPGNYIEATITDASGSTLGSSLRIPDYVDASIIKSGESIFGVTGTYTGPSYSFGSKTVDPSTSSRTYYASSNGYDGFSSFTVNAMPSGSLSTPSISIDSNGLITATSSVSSSGYLSTSASKSNTQQLTTRDSSDLTASGRTISVPSGYYPDGASKSVSSSYIIPSGGTTIYSNGNNINVKSLEYVNVQVTASPDPKTEETTCWAYGDSTYYGTAYISYEYWSDYYNDWQSDEVSESSPGSGVKATGRNFSVWIVY